MFEIQKPSENRVDIVIRGALDAEDMRKGLDELEKHSSGVVHGRMLYVISEFSMPSLGAIGVEFAKLPMLFGLLSKFDRCAVLSDAGWIRRAAEVEGALLVGLEIKSFGLEARAAAEAWLG